LRSLLFSNRWFAWQFEKAMQDFSGRCIYLPYWDSERDSQREWASHIFHEDTFGTWGGTRSSGGNQCTADGVFNSFTSPFGSSGSNEGQMCLERLFRPNIGFSGEAEVLAIMTNNDRYASGNTNGFRIDFEAGAHELVHVIVGGQMDSYWSVADPLFYLHHSNVDRLWTMWQDYWDHDEEHKDDLRDPWHYDGDLDRRLTFGSAADSVSWDFRMQYEDGTWDYPTAREVLSNDGDMMSVRYMNDRLATLVPGYQPNRRLIEASEGDVGVRCDRERWRRLKSGDAVGEPLADPLEENSLHGQPTTEQDFLETSMNEDKPSSCHQLNFFTLPEDRDEWDRLCRELPENTTVAERFALLAEKNCERRGNPRKDAVPSHMMKMMSGFPSTAFECFHRPQAAV
jgi:hypothetical protein